MSTIDIAVRVNGKLRIASVPPRLLLSDFIRQNLSLPGTHVGCEHGVCGCCTIIVDGAPARSCLMFAVQADGSEISTVESLGKVDALHPIQQAFWEEHGLQCGFCTPGMLMLAQDLLQRNPNPTEEEIRDVVSDNLCRCTGYQNIIASIQKAAVKMREAEASTRTRGDAAAVTKAEPVQ
jgi:aerobic carbon-monoxide dehydrogenase small subunit